MNLELVLGSKDRKNRTGHVTKTQSNLGDFPPAKAGTV